MGKGWLKATQSREKYEKDRLAEQSGGDSGYDAMMSEMRQREEAEFAAFRGGGVPKTPTLNTASDTYGPLEDANTVMTEDDNTPYLDAVEEESQTEEEEEEYTHEFGGKRYNLGDELGGGTFGSVHELDPIDWDDDSLALKTAKKQEGEKELAHENAVLETVGPHPNIVGKRGYNAPTNDKGGELALEFLGGGDVDKVMKKAAKQYEDGALSHSEYWGVIQHLQTGTMSGLSEMHSHDKVHGDLKPQNVGLDDEGTPKLIDFGSARDVGDKPGPQTPMFNRAPEQYMDPKATKEADTYAVGQMAHLAGEGKVGHWSGETAMQAEFSRAQAHDEETPLFDNEAKSSSAYGKYVGGLLAKPEERLGADDALDSDFLKDPLLQEEDAKLVIQRLTGYAFAEEEQMAELGPDLSTEKDRLAKDAMLEQLKKR